MINYISPFTGKDLWVDNSFLISDASEKFPIVKGIPRFVKEENYAEAFGFQWKAFSKTQLDSYSKIPISKQRLERCLGVKLSALKGKTVLEAGCGAGRFTELLVNAGAFVHSIDLSIAVEANKENVGERENYKVAQANIYALPYPKKAFDLVICLGVVQHTPSSEKTIRTLWEMVKPGGLLVIDHYLWKLRYYTTLTPLYRKFIKRMKPEKSKRVVDKLFDFFFPIHWAVRKSYFLDGLVHRVSPLIVYSHIHPEWDKKTQYEWSKLDTYDQLTDYYKHLKTPSQIRKILEDLKGVSEIHVEKAGNGIEGRCRKKV